MPRLDERVIQESQIELHFGEHDITDRTVPLVLTDIKVNIHPLYNPTNPTNPFDYDFALLELPEAIDLTYFSCCIAPVCLPTRNAPSWDTVSYFRV